MHLLIKTQSQLNIMMLLAKVYEYFENAVYCILLLVIISNFSLVVLLSCFCTVELAFHQEFVFLGAIKEAAKSERQTA